MKSKVTDIPTEYNENSESAQVSKLLALHMMAGQDDEIYSFSVNKKDIDLIVICLEKYKHLANDIKVTIENIESEVDEERKQYYLDMIYFDQTDTLNAEDKNELKNDAIDEYVKMLNNADLFIEKINDLTRDKNIKENYLIELALSYNDLSFLHTSMKIATTVLMDIVTTNDSDLDSPIKKRDIPYLISLCERFSGFLEGLMVFGVGDRKF